MRQAPAWRKNFPTMREVRFNVNSRLFRVFPEVYNRFNVYKAISGLEAIHPWLLSTKILRSEISLSRSDIERIESDFALEKEACQGVIFDHGEMHVEIFELNDCFVLGHTGETVLRESKLQLNRQFKNNTRMRVLKDKAIPGTSINFLGLHKGHKHYYKFLVNFVYVIIEFLDESADRYEKLNILVRSDASKVQRALFQAIQSKYKNVAFIFVENTDRVLCDKVIHFASKQNCVFRSPVRRSGLDSVADLYRTHYGIPEESSPQRKLYISRRDARIRRIINEDEVVELLRQEGFESICPGEMTHEEQVRAFSQAKMIVSPHGAGLTNLMFTTPGGRVIELFGADYVQSAYLWMSRLKNHAYHPVICSPGEGHQHFTVDAAAMRRLLHLVRSEDATIADDGMSKQEEKVVATQPE